MEVLPDHFSNCVMSYDFNIGIWNSMQEGVHLFVITLQHVPLYCLRTNCLKSCCIALQKWRRYKYIFDGHHRRFHQTSIRLLVYKCFVHTCISYSRTVYSILLYICRFCVTIVNLWNFQRICLHPLLNINNLQVYGTLYKSQWVY